MSNAAEAVREAVNEAHLVYVSDEMPGIRRQKVDGEFHYLQPSGEPVSEKDLNRIHALGIPPAYEDVWVCPLPNGHLQATGRDARGRKQYRYHALFREIRDQEKFSHVLEFGKNLDAIHMRLARDLRKAGLPREKVLAAVVSLLERSLIRVGNEEYAKSNRSYGLTTLKNRHVTIEGSDINFHFLGKSKVRHRITLHDPRMAKIVRRIQELPGQSLFQYLDDEGNRHSVSSHDVNAYLKEISGHDFTAKDFRTWAATVLALSELLNAGPPESAAAAKRRISQAIKAVSGHLGNTPAICRKCYVHPTVLDLYSRGALHEHVSDAFPTDIEALPDNWAESLVMRLLA